MTYDWIACNYGNIITALWLIIRLKGDFIRPEAADFAGPCFANGAFEMACLYNENANWCTMSLQIEKYIIFYIN